MSDDPTSLILRVLDQQEKNFNRRMDNQDRTLTRVETKVDGHDERLDSLESERDVHIGRVSWLRLAPQFLSVGFGALLSVVGALVLAHG